VGKIKLPHVQEAEPPSPRDVKFEALVVIIGWINVKTIGGVQGTWCAGGRVVKNKCFLAERRKQCLVEIKCPVKFLICRDVMITL
jgi:hypothetical protein